MQFRLTSLRDHSKQPVFVNKSFFSKAKHPLFRRELYVKTRTVFKEMKIIVFIRWLILHILFSAIYKIRNLIINIHLKTNYILLLKSLNTNSGCFIITLTPNLPVYCIAYIQQNLIKPYMVLTVTNGMKTWFIIQWKKLYGWGGLILSSQRVYKKLLRDEFFNQRNNNITSWGTLLNSFIGIFVKINFIDLIACYSKAELYLFFPKYHFCSKNSAHKLFF